MMKRTLIIGITMLFAVAACGCHATDDSFIDLGDSVVGSGTVAKDVRSFSGLRGVHLETVGELRVEVGEKEELVIEMDDNLIEYITTSVDDGVLEIDMQRGISIRSRSKIRYTLTVASLEIIKASSSGDIIARDMKGDHLEIALSSSGDATVNLVDGRKVEISASSSGDVRIVTFQGKMLYAGLSSSGDLSIKEGQVDKQNVSLSSSGDYDAVRVKSREATVHVSSSGDARVWVTDKLRASTSSSGDIRYRGDAQVEARESSSGDVIRIK